MKNKQLLFINIIILMIFISVVRMGIKKENIAHARFIEESVQIENNKDLASNLTVSRNYHNFTISLGDIKHPPRFTKNNKGNPDEQEEAIEIEDETDEELELELGDEEINNEDFSAETEDYSETSNGSGNSGNSNRSNHSNPSGDDGKSEKVDNGGGTTDKSEGEPEPEPDPKPDPDPDPEPESNPDQKPDPEPDPEPENDDDSNSSNNEGGT